MRANMTNGAMSGMKLVTMTAGLSGTASAEIAMMKPATTGTNIGPAMLPRSSVRLMSDAIAANSVEVCKNPTKKKTTKPATSLDEMPVKEKPELSEPGVAAT